MFCLYGCNFLCVADIWVKNVIVANVGVKNVVVTNIGGNVILPNIGVKNVIVANSGVKNKIVANSGVKNVHIIHWKLLIAYWKSHFHLKQIESFFPYVLLLLTKLHSNLSRLATKRNVKKHKIYICVVIMIKH